MGIDRDQLIARLREAIGNDTQAEVGEKIHMTQSSVSKILTGAKTPSIDAICDIASVYNVSADWLLGITDESQKKPNTGKVTYASLVENIMDAYAHGTTTIEKTSTEYTIKIEDPFFWQLMKMGMGQYAAGGNYYKEWVTKDLSTFTDAPLYLDLTREYPYIFDQTDGGTISDLYNEYQSYKKDNDTLREMLYDR